MPWARERLAATAEPELAARLLLAHVLGCTPTDLFVHPERPLDEAGWRAFRALVARRERHEPVPYLVGHRGFLDMDLLVDRHVLIPRPETEELIERATALAHRWETPRVVDVGAGSGAIAIALARRLPRALVYATDRSEAALAVARSNAQRCGVAERIVLPYVSQAEYEALPLDIRLWEPREALVGGADGLDAIRALLLTAPEHLAPGGAILLEIGAEQGAEVAALAAQAFPCARVDVIPDLAGRDRIVHVDLL